MHPSLSPPRETNMVGEVARIRQISRSRGPNFISLYRHCPLYPDTSFVFFIPHHLAEVSETGASASESFNEIDFTPGRTTKVPASEGIVLGMLDDVLLTVSHVLFLESSPPLPFFPPPSSNVKYSKRLLRFLKLQYRAALYAVAQRAFHSRFSYDFQLSAIYYYFIVLEAHICET